MKRFTYLFVVILSISLFSCSENAPQATDETIDKGHDQWQKVIFRFSQGEEKIINGEKYLEVSSAKKNEELKLPLVQEYIFRYTESGVVADNNNPILLEGGKSYTLEILYYNRKNELMNYEFITSEMAPIHQHFFIPESINSIKEGVEKGKKDNIISYYYRDTNPYNKTLNEQGVSLRKVNDPIGLKGYFTVNKSYQSFYLKIVLVHVVKGSKLSDDGSPYPFYSPSIRVLGVTDLSVKIPIKVFTSSTSPNYENDISKEFTIPLGNVKEEISKRKNFFNNSVKIKY